MPEVPLRRTPFVIFRFMLPASCWGRISGIGFLCLWYICIRRDAIGVGAPPEARTARDKNPSLGRGWGGVRFV